MASHAIPVGGPTQAAAADEAQLNLPRWQANFWFTVICLIYIVDIADRNVIGMVVPAMKAEFALTDAEVGLIGSILWLSLGLLVIPCAWLVDKWSRKYMTVIMVTIWSLATYATSLAGGYSAILLARLGVGAGEAGYNPAGYALTSAWFPKSLRARMVGIFNMGQPIGQMIGTALGGWLILNYGWRAVFGLFAIPGFILAVLMIFAPDYKTKKVQTGVAQQAKAGFGETMRYIAKSPTLLALYLAQIPFGMWSSAAVTWAAAFFMRTYKLNVAEAGNTLAVIQLCVIVGPFLGGWLADWWVRRSVQGRVLASMVCVAWALVFWSGSFLGALAGLPLMAVAIFWIIGQLGNAAHFGGVIAAVAELVPPHYRGTAQSFIPLGQAIMGFVAGALAGTISDRLGLIWAMELTMAFGYGLMLVCLYFAARSYRRDHDRLLSLGSFSLDRN